MHINIMAAERTVSSLETPVKFRGALSPPSPDWATVDDITRHLAHRKFKPQKVVVAADRSEQGHAGAVAKPSEEQIYSSLLSREVADAACVTPIQHSLNLL